MIMWVQSVPPPAELPGELRSGGERLSAWFGALRHAGWPLRKTRTPSSRSVPLRTAGSWNRVGFAAWNGVKGTISLAAWAAKTFASLPAGR